MNSAINTFCFVFRLKLCHRFIKSINIEYSWYTCYCSLYWPSNSIFTTNCFLVKQEVRLKNDMVFFLNCDGKCPNWSNSWTTKKIVFLCSNLIIKNAASDRLSIVTSGYTSFSPSLHRLCGPRVYTLPGQWSFVSIWFRHLTIFTLC